MTFSRAEPNTHYRTLRLLSAEGLWELGLDERPTGTRLRMGREGRPPAVMDFCMGTDPGLYAPILGAVLKRLEVLPETATPGKIDARFPWRGTRPDLSIHLEALLQPD